VRLRVGAYDYAPNVVVVLCLYQHLFAGATAFMGVAKMGRNHTPLQFNRFHLAP